MRPSRQIARENEEQSRTFTRRALLLSGGMAAMTAGLGLRMHFLAVEQGEQFQLLSDENRINIRLIPPIRGVIRDRHGALIAGNVPNYRVILTPEEAGDVELVLQRLSHLFPLSAKDIENLLQDVKKNSRFVPLTVADRLDWPTFTRVSANSPALPGITPEVGLSRHYPRDTDFAHVVGYVGPVSDKDLEGIETPDPVLRIPKFQIGKIGVEKWMENDLRGMAGTRRIEVNHVGRVMRELDREIGQTGEELTLTIDADIQNFVQTRLGDESASCVVMDVRNGDLVAIVSNPSFDPNLFVRGISTKDYKTLTDDDHTPLANKSVQGAYPPGSTFKMVTALAALEAGVIDLESSVRCGGFLEAAGRKFHCWRRSGHGKMNLFKALEQSCDVYFYDIAQKVGIDKIAEMGRMLGLGQRHSLPMSAINEGTMPDKAWKLERYKKDWVIGDTINASIGQGFVLTTPLQLAIMTARMASGTNVSPRLIKAINGIDVPVPDFAPLPIQPRHLQAIRRGMNDVMNGDEGTARSSRIADETMSFAGKTGTAQVRNISTSERETGVISNEDLPWKQRDHALFVGYAPFDAPRYAVSVVVEHGGGGSTAAAPLARDAILRALSDGLPSLSAYPADQRGRMETLLNELPLRREDGTKPPSQEKA